MDIVIYQTDIAYRYRCNEKCDDCQIRFICYTHKSRHNCIQIEGCSYLDLQMIRARLDGSVDMIHSWNVGNKAQVMQLADGHVSKTWF